VDDLRARGAALKVVIDPFRQDIEPLCRAVAEAQAGYNEALQTAWALATGVTAPAYAQFAAKSERGQAAKSTP
jgi:hypothetical protein